MLENCSSHRNCKCGKRSASVIGKLTKVFSSRKTYQVQKIQQLNKISSTEPGGESSNSWVTVHSLQSQDGGILDPDDRLRDVADDREQIIAFYDDGDNNTINLHGGGDGASVTSSPDIFRSRDGLHTDIEVTNQQIACGLSDLHVRRGSEPALNQIPLECHNNLGKCNNNVLVTSTQSKRWSAAPMIHDPKEKFRTDDFVKISGFDSTDKWKISERDEDDLNIDEKSPVIKQFLAPPFLRDSSNRLSMQFLGESSSGFRWAEASDMANNRTLSLSLPRERNHRRKEPLGQAHSNFSSHLPESQNTEFIVLSTNGGSLGIHVIPDYNTLGKECGLLVQGIEPGGRVDCDGRLKVYDRIIEINGRSLLNQPFNVIQEIFRESLHSTELRLRVVKHKNNLDVQTSHNTVTDKTQPQSSSFPKLSGLPFSNKENFTSGPSSNMDNKWNTNTKIATISPTKKIISTPSTASNILMTANTRKIGTKLELELIKGSHGLGFSITTRDNPTGGNCPIYIKNVLPKGAAVVDGRLKPGDRLLAVNGIELTGKTQTEVVSVLRNIPSGTKVKIVVSRQEDINQIVQKPTRENDEGTNKEVDGLSENQLIESNGKSTKTDVQDFKDETQTFSWTCKDILTFNIPVYDSEKAGLGISVKGKTSSCTSNDKNISQDLGIFIKNVLHGGAASRDGRLCTNDQLLYINGISLIGQSNALAMETLRKTMVNTDHGLVRPGTISLTVARRRQCSPKLHRRRSRDSSSSLLTDSSTNTETFGFVENNDINVQNISDKSKTNENSDNVIYTHQGQSSENLKRNKLPTVTSSDRIAIHNPVLDRLTGNSFCYNGLHNESYYKATHQTTIMLKDKEKLNIPTINQSSADMLIIEEDTPNYSFVGREKKQEGKPISILPTQTKTESTSTDISLSSQLSLDNANFGFSRDGVGRQSMSEKRHATLDAKNTDTYKKNKKCREDRNGLSSKQQLGPSLGMKKSSSLESLQTMVQEVKMLDDRTKHGHHRNVHDKIYDQNLRVSIDGEENDYHQIGRRQSSLHSQIEYRPQKTPPPLVVNKKKPSLLKGIGSMFRFNKPRRELDLIQTNNRENDCERDLARRSALNEQYRIQQQYQKLIHRQAQEQSRVAAVVNGNITKSSDTELSRVDRIQQLRAEHQRRHMDHCQSIDDSKTNQPGSRIGIIDPTRFNHYVNFQEIQQNLNRRQFQYHSQRPKGSAARPSSNYYEYESVVRSLPYTGNGETCYVAENDDNSDPSTGQAVGGCGGNASRPAANNGVYRLETTASDYDRHADRGNTLDDPSYKRPTNRKPRNAYYYEQRHRLSQQL